MGGWEKWVGAAAVVVVVLFVLRAGIDQNFAGNFLSL